MMDSDGGPVTGCYLERIQSDLDNAVARIELRGNQITMGRGVGNNIIWESLQISRRHCVMEYRNQRWMILDTSTNGMLINSARITRNVLIPLNDNDIISFVPTGSLQYRFVRTSSPRKYSSPNASVNPAVVQNSTSSNNSITSSSSADIVVLPSSTATAVIKSPKRKTGTGPIEHVNPEKKRKYLHPSPSAVNPKLGTVDEEEEEELFDIDEVPSFFSSSKASHYGENNNIKYEHDLLDVATLKGLKEDDLVSVKNQFKKYEDRIRKLEEEKKIIVQEQRLELMKIQNQLKSTQSENRIFEEELFKKILEGLEMEFSCCICNEVFINATVIDCGHTFCSHCLSEWVKRKPECPTCRKQVRFQVKHIEMENFITKLHTVLSEEIQQKRDQVLQERKEAEAKAAATAAATAAAAASAAAAATARHPPAPRQRRVNADMPNFNPMDLIAEFIGQRSPHDILPSVRASAPIHPPQVMAHGPPDYAHPRHYAHHHFAPFIPYPDMMRPRQQATGPTTRRRNVRAPHRETAARAPGPVRGRGAQQAGDMPPGIDLEFNLGHGRMDILTVD